MNSLTIASHQRPWTTFGAFVVAGNVIGHVAYQSLEWLKESIRKSGYSHTQFTWTVLAASFCISTLAIFLLNRRVNPIVSEFDTACDKIIGSYKPLQSGYSVSTNESYYPGYRRLFIIELESESTLKFCQGPSCVVPKKEFGDGDEAVASLNKYSKFNDQFEFIKITSNIDGCFGIRWIEKNIIKEIVNKVVSSKESNKPDNFIEYTYYTEGEGKYYELLYFDLNSNFSNYIITRLQKLPTFENMQLNLVKNNSSVKIVWTPKS